MKANDKGTKLPNSTEEVAIRGMLLTDAPYEILVDKGIVTPGGVIEHIRKLESEIRRNLSRPN